MILPILGETGCRLSEVLGLMKQDVAEEAGLMVINTKETRIRTLKTDNSERKRLVVSKSAAEVLQTLLELSQANPTCSPDTIMAMFSMRKEHQLRSASTSRLTTAVRLSIPYDTA